MIVSAVSQMARAALRRCARAIARELAAFAVIAFFAAVAGAAALAAVYQALIVVWEPYWAAAAIAGGSLLVVLLTLAVHGWRTRRRAPPPDSVPDLETLVDALQGDTATLAQTAMDEAEARYRDDPAGFFMTVVAMGFIAGMMHPDERR